MRKYAIFTIIAIGLLLSMFAPVFGQTIATVNPAAATQVAAPAFAEENPTEIVPLYHITITPHVSESGWSVDITTDCPWPLEETFGGRRSGTWADSSTGGYISYVAICRNPDTGKICARATANLQNPVGPTPISLPTLTAIIPCTAEICLTPTAIIPTLTPTPPVPCMELAEPEFGNWTEWKFDEATGLMTRYRHVIVRDKNAPYGICNEFDQPDTKAPEITATVPVPASPTVVVPTNVVPTPQTPVCEWPKYTTDEGQCVPQVKQDKFEKDAAGLCVETSAVLTFSPDKGKVTKVTYHRKGEDVETTLFENQNIFHPDNEISNPKLPALAVPFNGKESVIFSWEGVGMDKVFKKGTVEVQNTCTPASTATPSPIVPVEVSPTNTPEPDQPTAGGSSNEGSSVLLFLGIGMVGVALFFMLFGSKPKKV